MSLSKLCHGADAFVKTFTLTPIISAWYSLATFEHKLESGLICTGMDLGQWSFTGNVAHRPVRVGKYIGTLEWTWLWSTWN